MRRSFQTIFGAGILLEIIKALSLSNHNLQELLIDSVQVSCRTPAIKAIDYMEPTTVRGGSLTVLVA
jgi:hypothetical protein